MELEDFYALSTGTAPSGDVEAAQLTVVDLGLLRVPSGKLGASDPFVNIDEPVVVLVPPGDYPVRVTIADVSPEQDRTHLREAYLSVVLSETATTSVEYARALNDTSEDGAFSSVGVDAGTVSFVDAETLLRSMPADTQTWYDDIFDSGEPGSWFSIMDAAVPQPAGYANIVLPLATNGENVVLAHSGWGDGYYPLIASRDAAGKLTGIHIELFVVGPDDEEEEADEPSVAVAETSSPRKSWISRLFGR
jgi:hypothetical protein